MQTNNPPDASQSEYRDTTPMPGLSAGDIRVLSAMRHGLLTSVAPELDSEMAKTICGFSVEFLNTLIAKYAEWPAILCKQNARQAKVCSEMIQLLGSADNEDMEELAAIEQQLAHQESFTLAALESLQSRINALLEKLVPQLFGKPTPVAPVSPEQLEQLLRDLAGSIQQSEAAVKQAIKHRVERQDTLVQSSVEVSREQIQHYLEERFPGRGNIEITSFRELPGGSSKSTILMDVKGFEHEGITPLVARLDRLAGSTDTRVIDEVPTLQAVFEQGLPAPEVLWAEPDASKVGLAFIGVRKIDAPLGGDMWHVDKTLCDASTALDLARILAKLHTLDIAKLGLRGALNSDPAVHPMRGLIDNIRGLWRQKKMEPDGILEACLCWLEQNMPPAPEKLSLIHADVSFHNILVKDKKIACLLDWELSHLGDPNEDLSYCRPCIEQLIPWEEFMAEYRRHGGIEYSEEIGRFYGIWRGVRNAVYTLTCAHSFHTDANPDFRWGFFASNYRLVLLEAVDKVAQAGASSLAGEKARRG